jgi:hypothetical protein
LLQCISRLLARSRPEHMRQSPAPKVRGVGVGERLSIVWPGAQSSSGYIAEHTCDPLALLTALFPDRMLALAMGEVERMRTTRCP